MAAFRSEHDHYKNILSSMNDQRNLETLCNVRIIVGSEELRAHRCVLMAASEYFSAVLARIDGDNLKISVDVSSATVDVHAVESVLNYIYSGEISINSDNLESIIKVASLFLRTDIKEFCCKFILDNLDWKTSMKYTRLLLDHGLSTVIGDFAQIVKSRFQSSILSDDSFQNICPQELKFLVETCDIFSENCDLAQIFKFLSDWVRCGKSEEHEQVGCDIIRHLFTKVDAKAMDSFSQSEFKASTFEEMFENVGLFLDFKLSKGSNEELFTDPQQNLTDTISEEITPIQDVQDIHDTDPDTPSEFPYQFDNSDNDELVDSDAMLVESTMRTNELHQTSVDMDVERVKREENTIGQSKVEIECIKEPTDKNMPFSCDKCHKRFNKRQILSNHKKTHTSKRLWKCGVCKKKFTLKRYLDRHRTVHSTGLKFSCSVCMKRFKWQDSLSKHMALHSDNTLHPCSECNEQFSCLSLLNSHMLKHSESKLSCGICGRLYQHKSALKKHVKKHKYDTGFTCKTCGLKYETCQALKDHIKLHKLASYTVNDMKRPDDKDNLVKPDTLASDDMDHIPLEKATTSGDMVKVQPKEQNQMYCGTVNTESLMYGSSRSSQRENDTLSCHICFKVFQKKQNLNIHVKLHTTARPFDCVICKKKFKTKPILKKHMVTHSNDRPHKCRFCENSFKTKEGLSSHMLVHSGVKRHVCKECNKSFAQSGNLKSHMLKHESAERKHVCKICRKMFKHKSYLEAHEKSHSKDNIYSCDTCGLQFEEQRAIQEHVKLHDSVTDPLFQIKKEIETLKLVNTDMETDTLSIPVSVKQENDDELISENIKVENDPSDTIAQNLKQDTMFKCGSCNKQFASWHLLRIHLKTHITSTPYDCVICKQKFKLKHYLKKHMTRHHSDVPDVCFRCPICQKQFREKSYLSTHMLFHEGIKRHFCSICNKGFVVKCALSTHMKTHSNERPFQCKTCFKQFKHNATLKRHVLTHTDTTPKSFVCEICGLKYKSQKTLKAHKKQMHTETPPVFQCEICNKNFKTKLNLRRHKDTHTDTRPFICPTCGKQFRRDRNLNRHMLTHSDEKPFTCDHCTCHFRDKGSLMRHQRIHTGEKSYYCKLCEKYFTRAENLKGHNARFHTDD